MPSEKPVIIIWLYFYSTDENSAKSESEIFSRLFFLFQDSKAELRVSLVVQRKIAFCVLWAFGFLLISIYFYQKVTVFLKVIK